MLKLESNYSEIWSASSMSMLWVSKGFELTQTIQSKTKLIHFEYS